MSITNTSSPIQDATAQILFYIAVPDPDLHWGKPALPLLKAKIFGLNKI